jgi:hypothetical protein
MIMATQSSAKLRRGLRIAVVGAVLCASNPATARMYQWVDPVTGSVQLSGAPPAWYRSEVGGPRVVVIERGRTIDDTARTVEPARRDALREAAFGEAAPTAPAAPKSPPAAQPPPQAEPPSTASTTPPKTTQLEEFKALLEAWDREQAAAAVQALEPNQPRTPEPSTAPPSP